jgi:HlyD family type I secretion membrane fusion protein
MNFEHNKANIENKADTPRARARYIAQSIQLEESDAPGVVSIGIITTVFLVIAFVVWTYITPVNEVSISEGKIVPQGNNHIVQHFEGGIVEAISVHEGQLVSQGDILLHVAPIAVESDYDQLRSRSISLQLKQIRLQAILNNEKPVFDEYMEEYSNLAKNEYETYLAQVKSHQSQLKTARSRVNQRKVELSRDLERVDSLGRELDVLTEQVEIRSDLSRKGLIAKTEILDRQAELANVRTDYNQARAEIEVGRAAVQEAEQSVIELDNRALEQIKLESTQVAGELAELVEQLVKFGDRVDRLQIRAPVSGYVTNLGVNSIRSVIEPSQILMEIVPSNKELVVESKISTQDIGHVHIGQNAVVKVGSYDPQRFGTVTGTVQRISPSTYFDEENQPYYKAQISLEKMYLGNENAKFRLIPGMTVQADILTGEKTVLDYLLKPVYRGFQNAFQER